MHFSEALNGLMQQYDQQRHILLDTIEKLAAELEDPAKRNADAMTVQLATIEAQMRDFKMFLVHMNQVRVQEEGNAESHDDIINKRREWGAATARTNLFQTELNRWYEIKKLVLAQKKPPRRKLYVSDEKLAPTTLAQMKASDDVFTWLHKAFNPSPQSKAAEDMGCYPDIGLSNSDFHAHMHAAYRVCLAQRRRGPIRFLDVGCGGGLKVYSALRYFDACTGIDIDPAYVKAGDWFLKSVNATRCGLLERDALSFDDYDKFDVIYFYRPLQDEGLLHALEARIAETAQKHAVLVAPYLSFPDRYEDLKCGHVDGAVYLAQSSQRVASSIRRKAECIGEHVLHPKAKEPTSIWQPLIQASQRNGFDFPNRHEKPRY